MPRKKTPVDPDAVAYAREAHAAGRSYREISDELGELEVSVSHMQVKRWCDAAKAGAPPPPTLADRVREQRERAAAAAPPPEDPAEPFDFESSLQRMIRQAEDEARAHEQASNPRGAQAAMRRAAELMKVLAQSEKRKPADPDVLTFSKAEIDREFSRVGELLAQLCERPVLCSECNRALSVKFGRGQG